MKRFVSIVVSVALCLIVGFVSQRIQMEPLHSWYPLLNKSSLTPLKKKATNLARLKFLNLHVLYS